MNEEASVTQGNNIDCKKYLIFINSNSIIITDKVVL